MGREGGRPFNLKKELTKFSKQNILLSNKIKLKEQKKKSLIYHFMEHHVIAIVSHSLHILLEQRYGGASFDAEK